MSAGAGQPTATAGGTAEPETRLFLLSPPEMSMVSAMRARQLPGAEVAQAQGSVLDVRRGQRVVLDVLGRQRAVLDVLAGDGQRGIARAAQRDEERDDGDHQ